MVWLDDSAVFVGDLLHTPQQVGRPTDSCAFDLDADRARLSRRAVLDAAARRRATVLPTHLAGHGAIGVTTGEVGVPTIGSWAELPQV